MDEVSIKKIKNENCSVLDCNKVSKCKNCNRNLTQISIIEINSNFGKHNTWKKRRIELKINLGLIFLFLYKKEKS